jgi:glycosyltransferase involved in cell wall biosynthesis
MFTLASHLTADFDIHVALPNEPPYRDRFRMLLGEDRLMTIPHRQFKFDSLWSLVREINRRNIDIIHSHGKGAGIYGRLAALLTNRRSVHTFHGVHIGRYGKLKRFLYLTLERLFSSITRAIIAVSSSEREQMVTLRIAPPGKISIVENGIEIPSISQRKQNTSNRHHIVTVTRFDYAKNPELLGEIIRILLSGDKGGQFVFDVIGDGEDRQAFEKSVSDYIESGQVVMHGFLMDPFQIISNSWFYLSTSRWESFGLATAEALVRSVPVIATNVTGSIDLIANGENGFLFPLDRPDEAVRLISELASDDSLYVALSVNARKSSVERFSANRMADETSRLYRQLLET